MMRRAAAVVLALIAALVGGCGASPITSRRLERALEPAFANLVHAQVARLGLPPVGASDIKVTAACYRLDGRGSGAGDWVCTLVWSGPNGATLHDKYDVSVSSDGCYTATADAAEAQLGGPIVTTTDGRVVRNLLHAFDGCFDTTGIADD
jgi:hypothetical protein